MAKVMETPEAVRKRLRKQTKEQEEALAWVKKRARSRDTKHAALPEAEGAAIGEPSRPGKPARRRR